MSADPMAGEIVAAAVDRIGPPPDSTPEQRFARTVEATGRRAQDIALQARTIGETIEALSHAFASISGDGDRQSLGSFGLVGLPLMATWTAIRKVVEQYVGQRTGRSLPDWIEFVDGASGTFGGYVEVLESFHHRTVTGSVVTQKGDPDVGVLESLRRETRAWKVVLGGVSQVGQLVEAILAARSQTDDVALDEPASSSGVGAKFQKWTTEAVNRTSLGTTEVREWLFRPVLDLRERVEELPARVGAVAEEVALLEVWLELAIAQGDALRGGHDQGDVRLVEMRVAGTILVPALMERLDGARAELQRSVRHLHRLGSIGADGGIDQATAERLAQHYRQRIGTFRELLGRLEHEAGRWRAGGPAAIDACLRWIDGELAVLEARRLVEDDGDGRELADRVVRLRVERHRLEPVRAFLGDS